MPRPPTLLLLPLALLASLPLYASELAWRADHRPRFVEFVREEGKAYGLFLASNGVVVLERRDPATGRLEREALRPEPTIRLMEFVGKMPRGRTEAHMVRALRAYLEGRDLEDKAFEATLIARGPDGKEKLTELGRSLLIDILTAEDGTLFKETTGFKFKHGRGRDVAAKIRTPNALPQLKLPKAAGERLDAAGLAKMYDGAGPGGDSTLLAGFDWGKMGSRPTVAADPELQRYAVDAERGVLRVMVEAGRAVRTDRLAGASDAEGSQALKEAGLDAKLFAAHGARVVRAVDRLVTVEVPLPQAASLGLALQDQGILSRPSRVFKAAAAGVGAAGWLAPTTQFLPFPLPMIPGAERDSVNPFGVQPLNADGRRMLGWEGLWKRGMTGKGSVVGIIDTGLDPDHPDFKGRVLEYLDFTSETNNKDGFGHGTHVAGSVGGSGEASKGLYKGAAPDTKFVILKVFDKDGNTTEDAILAAMKKAAALPAGKRPQVINMSLGGPGDPITDPMSQMANRLMLKENILVVAAAGNGGPGAGTVPSPGNAQYVLTVGGVDKQGEFPFFSGRGPVQEGDGDRYAKPDLSTVAGGLNLAAIRGNGVVTAGGLMSAGGAETANHKGGGGPMDSGGCPYGPGGVVSGRSSDDKDTKCTVLGHPEYRYMSGTSMATPMAAGAAADVIGYLRTKGVDYRATEIKAVMMETARDLGKPRETQGAGLMNGERLAATVANRVQAGVPVGNIAYMLAVRLTSDQQKSLAAQSRFRMTPLGIVDTENGRLIKTDKELFDVMRRLDKPMMVAFRKENGFKQPERV